MSYAAERQRHDQIVPDDETGNIRTCATIGTCTTPRLSGVIFMTEQVETTTERRTDQINLSDVAAGKIKSLLEQEGRDDLALRISVQPGGCSGLRYQLFFDERTLDGDVTTDFDGVTVVVDRMSVPYLNGAEIDFVDTIEKQGFTIDNPNATGSCACGDSFH
jgi:iron-sulfur cluster assembly accessory protein